MSNQIIMNIAFLLLYYNTSGLATTNILRLTKGNTLPVLSSKCVCDNCGAKISPLLQQPIVSYLICGGRCRNCKIKLPIYTLILEIVILTGMYLISWLFDFSLIGVSLSFLYYELVRIMVIVIRGKRQDSFVKQYIVAVLATIPFYVITLFVAVLYREVV